MVEAALWVASALVVVDNVGFAEWLVVADADAEDELEDVDDWGEVGVNNLE